MKHNELIKVNENFQYSVNLQFDINNIEKILEYIPTKDVCEILNIYVNSAMGNKNRSTTLIGPYGKGKSHLLLVLTSLLNDYKKENEEKINKLMNKIKLVDSNLYNSLIELRKNKFRLMPIIINSNYSDLNQAFLLALKDAIDREGLRDITLKNYFDIALKVIEKWEEKYSDARNEMEKCLKQSNSNLRNLKEQLKNCSQQGYENFKNIYTCVQHGEEFSPLVNSDIVKTYKDFTYTIKNIGFSGVFIVFDEFSKFLESVDSSKMMRDLKILQDFAELASRTGKEEQIHLCCITHKTLNEYSKNFSDEKKNAFKTVEGRFKTVYFTKTMEQSYELIGHALIKSSKFDEFFNLNYSNSYIYKEFKKLNIFNNTSDIDKSLFKNCFPLNPLTVYTLINLSEKIAQNERTLFTFLADDDENGLKHFIRENNTNELFNVDKIYDYFYNLIKKEQDENIKNIWLKTETCIKKVNGDINSIKILKTLAVIYMINDLDTLMPNSEMLQLGSNLSKDIFENAIAQLIEKSLIRIRKIDSYYDFANIYNRNLVKKIKLVANTDFTNVSEKDILNKVIDLGYILPRGYNEKYKMTRFFKNILITEEEILNLKTFDLFFNEEKTDGIILNLIRKSNNIQNIRDKVAEISDKRVILKIPKYLFSEEIIYLLREYEAIRYLKYSDELEKEMMDELILIESETIEAIITEVENDYFSIDKTQEFYYLNKQRKNKENLSKIASMVCEEIYSQTPVINNEMINKDELSAPIKKAREIVINAILYNDKNQLTSKTSSDATIYNAIKNKENELKEVINVIKEFIKKSDNKKSSFDLLYNELENEPYSIRKGVLPILISMALYDYSENIILYFQNREIDLNSENLVKINDNPDKYFLVTEKGTSEKIRYINELGSLFNVSTNENLRNILKNVVNSMKKWTLSLPKILREMYIPNEDLGIKEEYLKVKKYLLSPDLNNNEFLYITLPSIFSKDYSNVINEIKNMNNSFNMFMNNYFEIVSEKTKKQFKNNYNGTLSASLREWYRNLDKNVIKNIYDNRTKRFLDYIGNINTHNDSDIIENISLIMTDLYIEDWNMSEIDTYIDNLNNSITKILEKKEINTNKKIMLIDGEQKIEKNISATSDLSLLGKTLKNNIEDAISEYGDSLTEVEKVEILLDIMKQYM